MLSLLGGYLRLPGRVIGNGFKIVGAAEERAQIRIKLWLVPHHPAEYPLHPAMPLDDATCALDNQRLGCVQPGQIGGATRFVRLVVEHAFCLGYKLAGLAQERGRGLPTTTTWP